MGQDVRKVDPREFLALLQLGPVDAATWAAWVDSVGKVPKDPSRFTLTRRVHFHSREHRIQTYFMRRAAGMEIKHPDDVPAPDEDPDCGLYDH